MSVVEELIRKEENGTLSFGNYELTEKSKKTDFEHEGALYKVKTFKDITKLERDGIFVYESVPGTTVTEMSEKSDGISFHVEGPQDAQITVELEEDTSYEISIDGALVDEMKTNLGGKLSFSVELEPAKPVSVQITKQ